MSSLVRSCRQLCLSSAILLFLSGAAIGQQKAEKSNMELVGYNDLQARSAYQPTIHKQGNRWIAYVGLAVILYVAVEMIFRGTLDVMKVAST